MNSAGRLFGVWLLILPAVGTATPEQDLRYAAQDAERYFERAGLLADHPDPTAYLQRILQKLVDASPGAALGDCRAHLLRATRPNAFALPNCRLYLSTALFLALENEAQVAAVLARELAHVQLGSVALNRRELTQKLDAANFFGNLLAAMGGGSSPKGLQTPTTDAVGDLIWRVSVSGFTDEIELRAERDGLARLQAAGYTVADAVRMIERLRAIAPDLSEGQLKSAPLMSSPPRLAARLARLRLLGASSAEGAAPASSSHAAYAAPLRLGQIAELIKAGDGAAAQQLLAEQVSQGGESGMTCFLTGELERGKGERARAAALAAYERGVAFADAPAQLFLNLGMMLRESGEHARARVAFERFLELEPVSAEADVVRYYLSKSVQGS